MLFSCFTQVAGRFYAANKGQWTSRDVMAAILLIKGPVVTDKAIKRYGPAFLRHSTVKQFIRAATSLQDAGLGFLMKLPRGTEVFVKKFPNEVQQVLNANPDLCAWEDYSSRFFLQPPGCITPAFCQKLIDLGVATRQHFQGSNL